MLPELSQIYRRHSRRISNIGLELVDDIDEKLKNLEAIVDSTRTAKQELLRRSLEKQQEIVDIIRDSKESGFECSYMELFAIMAIRYGFTKDSLYQFATAFSAMANKRYFRKAGENPGLRWALQHDLVSRVEECLDNFESPITSRDIMRKLNLENIKNNYFSIRSALNLLELINKVIRLPHVSEEGVPYMWISSKFRNSSKTIPYWNLAYIILLALRDGGAMTRDDLAKNPLVSNLASVHPFQGRFNYMTFNTYALDFLILAGLVEYKKGKRVSKKSTLYSITPYGSSLLRNTENWGYLDEELRVELLGEKYVGLRPSEIMALRRIRLTAFIFANQYKSTYLLSKILGVGSHYVSLVRSGSIDPLRFFKEETLRQKYYPLIFKEEQRGLEIYLTFRRERQISQAKN
ncbi:hypothetical protein HYX02_05385 [Candidatus Woesearchaeota archaeon]|nr:hypothetical protein [Candidatus Woesearchaeota archaeon]